jgi:hypothetical protein
MKTGVERMLHFSCFVFHAWFHSSLLLSFSFASKPVIFVPPNLRVPSRRNIP